MHTITSQPKGPNCPSIHEGVGDTAWDDLTVHANEAPPPGLNPEPIRQWTETVHNRFTTEQRSRTTVIVSGLTRAHDEFIAATFRGFGYRSISLDIPDLQAMRIGREFGNRGQCNPAYFTTGNLIRFLQQLECNGLSKSEIIDRYLFLTINGCGPCRFSVYLTEFRKALRDSGFEGFRVLLFSQSGTRMDSGEGTGLDITMPMLILGLKGVLCADILNLLGYRIRPYEMDPGATDAAIQRSIKIVIEALENRRSLLWAMWRARRHLAAVRVNRCQVKPRVSLIGEFWALTTEGDGNYHLQRFLEQEGAEVCIQPLIGWLLTILWEYRFDTRLRLGLKGTDTGGAGLAEASPRKGLAIAWLVEKLVRLHLFMFSRLTGLKGYTLPNLDQLASLAHPFFDNNQRGGEMFVEVGKFIEHGRKRKFNLTLSVKPFGCMPSSGVSDGVQSLLSERFPHALFLAIETTGDSGVNVHSRVQMQLFKARRQAEREVAQAMDRYGMDRDKIWHRLQSSHRVAKALHYPSQRAGSTAADLIHEMGRKQWGGLYRLLGPVNRRSIM